MKGVPEMERLTDARLKALELRYSVRSDPDGWDTASALTELQGYRAAARGFEERAALLAREWLVERGIEHSVGDAASLSVMLAQFAAAIAGEEREACARAVEDAGGDNAQFHASAIRGKTEGAGG